MVNSPSRFYWSQGRKGRTPICWRSLEIWSECAARLDSGPAVALADVPMRRGADYERRQRYSSPNSGRLWRVEVHELPTKLWRTERRSTERGNSPLCTLRAGSDAPQRACTSFIR
jgi:hypothetical protein